MTMTMTVTGDDNDVHRIIRTGLDAVITMLLYTMF